jgi:hypothetical protein
MTVYLADAHTPVQKLISEVKMATMLEECTAEEQRSVLRFLRARGLDAKIFIKKYFLFTVEVFIA